MSDKEKAQLAGRAPEQFDSNQISANSIYQESVGSQILDEILAFLKRFISYPDEWSAIAHTLWIAHTHLMVLWESTPRLAFLSAQPGSGKTRALEMTELLASNPVEAVSMSPSSLFRLIHQDDDLPTILLDEVDTIFGPRAKSNEELRALLNSGHRRGAHVCRSVGDSQKGFAVEKLSSYCAVALAGLGTLPDTILSRSVLILMRPRALKEKVEPFRRRMFKDEGYALRDGLADWAARLLGVNDNEVAWPSMPDGVEDRDADIWEPLITIADAAGGRWPQMARVTAVTLVTQNRDNRPNHGIRLLTDLKAIFEDRAFVPTKEIIKRLNSLENSDWSEFENGGISPRQLARMLKPYGVEPSTVRAEGLPQKGYRAFDLKESWSRYVICDNSSEPVTSVTAVTL